MKIEKMLAIWGKGQIISLSGMNEKNDYCKGLVFTTGKDFSLNLRIPAEGKVKLGNRIPDDLFLACDLIESGSVRAVFVDSHHFLIEGKNIATELPEEIAVIQKNGRTLIGTKEFFNPSLIDSDITALIQNKKDYFTSLPDFGVTSEVSLKTLAKAYSQIKCQVNSPDGRIRRRWTTPDRWPHRNMWLWDTVFHALGLRHIDNELAKETVAAVLDRQLDDGLIPHMMGPDCASEITQPPILAFGIRELLKQQEDTEFLKSAFPKLERYVEWIMMHRDTDGLGLVEWFIEGNPFCRSGESGMDNSPRFDSATELDAPDFNAYLSLECESLMQFAEKLGLPEKVSYWKAHHERLNKLINDLLWNEEERIYMDRDVRTGKFTGIASSAGFLPLICGAPSQKQLELLLANLKDPSTFATPLRIPSISRKCKGAYSKDMWRGPVWVNINYLTAFGLERYGLADEAHKLLDETMAEEEKFYLKYGTFFEYYDDRQETDPPELLRKGKCAPEENPYNQVFHDYGWSATLYIDMLAKKSQRK